MILGGCKKAVDPEPAPEKHPEYFKVWIKYYYWNSPNNETVYEPPVSPSGSGTHPSDYVRKYGESFVKEINYNNSGTKKLRSVTVIASDIDSKTYDIKLFEQYYNPAYDTFSVAHINVIVK